VRFEAILFDVGDTLLHVPENPHKLALESVAHLGRVALPDYMAAIEQLEKEWREAGGLPEHEDLTETWIDRTTRALERLAFSGNPAEAAALMEHSFLKEGWVLFPEAV
jgi:FMN phosphatase YigB (HAD superfamily)